MVNDNKTKMTKCSKCKKNMNIGKQLSEWDKLFGSEWNVTAMINIICPHCNKEQILITLDMYEETEDVESPIGNVKVPKL